MRDLLIAVLYTFWRQRVCLIEISAASERAAPRLTTLSAWRPLFGRHLSIASIVFPSSLTSKRLMILLGDMGSCETCTHMVSKVACFAAFKVS
uniref:Putative secreted protein n=1 Tax=Ixodes ricinus TaxID=34613 RepID=A0A6B0U863_IXORI